MPVRHARSETRGRPPFGRRGGVGKNGPTRSHNGSGSSAAAIPVHATSPTRIRYCRFCYTLLAASPCYRQCHGHLAARRLGRPSRFLGNAFELRKPKGLRELHAVCRLDTHRFGYELRLEVNGLMSRTQVCRSTDDALDLSEQWRAAMLEKGWQE